MDAVGFLAFLLRFRVIHYLARLLSNVTHNLGSALISKTEKHAHHEVQGYE
jgi:hypothetical protein